MSTKLSADAPAVASGRVKCGARRDARLLAQKHSPGVLMLIESEISCCGRAADTSWRCVQQH